MHEERGEVDLVELEAAHKLGGWVEAAEESQRENGGAFELGEGHLNGWR